MIPIYEPLLEEDDIKAIEDAAKSGWVSSKGKYIAEFEEKFSSFIGKKLGVSTSNGTSALHLALLSLEIGPGDQVIVPDLTFASPINAVLYQRATPVLVDVDNESWALDPDEIRKSITPQTKAILVVHLYGNSAFIDEIKEIADENSLYLIEDCAESIGAKYHGSRIGKRGIISCFSFYGNKIITTGEGGMCLTDDKDLMDSMKMLRDHGMSVDNRYWHEKVGYNYRMTNIQAALGLSQLSKIDRIISKKRHIAEVYKQNLHENIEVQHEIVDSESVYWLYSILLEDMLMRDNLSNTLTKNDYETRKFFYPIHSMPPYEEFAMEDRSYSVSESLSRRGMNLPSSPTMTDDLIVDLCKLINKSLIS